MPKPTILALPLALIATLALPAGAQMDLSGSEEQATTEPMTSGPKRVRAPGAEEAAQGESAAETEVLESEILAQEQPAEAAQSEAEAGAEETGAGPFVGDYTLGDPDAPVQVIEYASFTCPHCASFHVDHWPELKTDFVDTDQIGFTLREVYFDRYGLWASMTARCGGEAAFYPMADLLLKEQSEWADAENKGQAIAQIGRRAGLSDEQLKGCLENQEFATLLVEDYQDNAEADEVRSTPTFIVRGPNGEERVVGNSPEELRAAVEAAIDG